MQPIIDLHTHSTFSDGSLTPTELVAEAGKVGLAALSLTDHDTTRGIDEFLRASADAKIEAVAGVEVSVEVRGRTVHMLGYGIDPGHADLVEALGRVVEGRNDRNARIIRKLQMLGIRIELEEVQSLAGEDVVGRPHVAQALISKGIVSTFDEAFDRYLARNAPAYCERFRLTPEEAIRLIDAAGGVSVLAHPYLIGANSPGALEVLVKKMKASGLSGLEAIYTEHTAEQTQEYLDLAKQFDLLATGGTDFHGAIKPDTALGRGKGDLEVPYALFEPLCKAIEKRRTGLVRPLRLS